MSIAFAMLSLLFLSAGLRAEQEVFPAMEATDLNKQSIRLPGGLAGELNLLLMAFERRQQADIDTWLGPLPALAGKHSQLAYYEIPVISRMNFVMRWVIDNGMRGGIPDKAQRARTITLYLDKKLFLAALDINSEQEIHALLVNRAGVVVWRSTGVASEEKLRSLEAFLDAQ